MNWIQIEAGAGGIEQLFFCPNRERGGINRPRIYSILT